MTSTLRPGHLLSALGALLAAGSLWLPWYGLDLGGAVDDAVARQTPKGAGRRARRPARPRLRLRAGLARAADRWRAFSTTDVVLAVGALAVLLAVGALAAGGELGGAGGHAPVRRARRRRRAAGRRPDRLARPARTGCSRRATAPGSGLAGTLLVALGAWWASVPARTAPAPPPPAAFADARATADSIAPPLRLAGSPPGRAAHAARSRRPRGVRRLRRRPRRGLPRRARRARVDRVRAVHEPERAWAIRDGGRIVATAASLGLRAHRPRRPVPMAGVTAVGVRPTTGAAGC